MLKLWLVNDWFTMLSNFFQKGFILIYLSTFLLLVHDLLNTYYSQFLHNMLATCSQFLFTSFTSYCSALVRNNVTPCLWLVNNFFTIFSKLVYMRTTSLWLIHNWFTTCSWFGHNLFTTCLIIFHQFHPIWSISQFTITKL